MSSFFNIVGHSELLGHGEGANSQSTSCSLGEGGRGVRCHFTGATENTAYQA